MTFPNTTSTQIDLPKIGFGAGAFSGAYNSVSKDECYAAVERSLELGINYFDTSPYYGESEAVLGEGLKRVQEKFPRATYSLSTKVGRYGYRKEDFDYSAERVVESVQESMRRLNTDYLDIVLCHDVEFVPVEQVVDHALPQLFRFKEEGRIHQVGISGYPLDVLLNIARIQHERNQPLDVVLSYCHYTLQNTLLAEYLPRFKSYGVVHVINASPLSMGLFREGPTPDWHPGSDAMKEAVRLAKEVCVEHGVKISEVASKFAFNHPGFASTIIGCCKAEEIQQAYEQSQMIESGDRPVDSVVLAKILRLMEPFHNYSWPSPTSAEQ
ncbi:Aldo/keto reductase, partial [Basidiobolus meristosporus CBS 931.73]